MSITYTPTTNFGSKDVLPANDPNKVIVGAEFTSEFTAIQAAFALAAPTSNPTFSGTATYNDLTVSGSFTSRGIDDNATSTAITIDSSENVGIGKDPTEVLTVTGNINLNPSSTSSADRLAPIYIGKRDAGTTGWMANIGFEGADSNGFSTDITFSTKSNDLFNGATIERMRIDSTGNVGIGEPDPSGYWTQASDLVVASTSNGGMTIKTPTTGSGRIAFTDTKSATAGLTDGGLLSYEHTSDSMTFGTAGVQRAVINSAGFVGIGTSFPMEDLSIRASANTAGFSVAAGSTQCFMRYNNYWDGVSQVSDVSKGSASVGLGKSNDGVITLNTAAAGAGTPAERVRINNTGKVGIGTDDPNMAVEISGTANFSTANTGGLLSVRNTAIGADAAIKLYSVASNSGSGNNGAISFDAGSNGTGATSRLNFTADAQTSTTPMMTIDGSGNVGIGTSQPGLYNTNANDLVVGLAGTGGNQGLTVASGSSSFGTIAFANGATGNDLVRQFIRADHSDGAMLFATGAGEKMRIASTGNVGIGYGAPETGIDCRTTDYTYSATNKNIYASFGSSASGIRLGLDSSSGNGVIGTKGSNDIEFVTYDGGWITPMTIGNSGNVGIGTNAPLNTLQVRNTTNSADLDAVAPTIALNHQSGTYTADHYYNVLGFSKANSNGTTMGATIAPVMDSIGNTEGLTFGVAASGSTLPVEAMRIEAGGNVLIGAKDYAIGNAGFKIAGSGLARVERAGTASQTHFIFTNGNGDVGSVATTGSTTVFNTSSDERLKENVVDAPAGNIDSIKVRSFDWKADGSHQEHGFIAQELETVAPYAVTKGETDEDMWAVDYSKLVPMLVKEIQDLKAEVEALKNA
jgi:hypothetical protein